ncbi:MAG: HAMP domain-containing sensor histidine kinase [Candidatus Gastranaerophilales bacterium]|nr:HAMP domain-containing sensor histidine kinase [Candidatus Gastranaerophilales bacterium]
MIKTDKQQEDFISTVSHELRTPLTSIRGFAQTMLSSWDGLDDESKKKFIQIIEQQSNRLINLVENMLSVNKLQSFKDKLIYKSVNANALIETVIQFIKHQYPNHNFETQFNKKIPQILVDTDKFQQIMTNLIENASKYSNEGTNITVVTDFSSSPDYVSIKVKDEGIGIKEEDFDKIFTKFSRLDNPLTRKIQGSGLGLYITKTLVQKMNGKISVQSNDNGTTFEVLLPTENVETQLKEAKSKKQKVKSRSGLTKGTAE